MNGRRNLGSRRNMEFVKSRGNIAAPRVDDDDDDALSLSHSAAGVNLAHPPAAKRRRGAGSLPLRRNAAFPFLRPRMERGSSEREVAGYIVR